MAEVIFTAAEAIDRLNDLTKPVIVVVKMNDKTERNFKGPAKEVRKQLDEFRKKLEDEHEQIKSINVNPRTDSHGTTT